MFSADDRHTNSPDQYLLRFLDYGDRTGRGSDCRNHDGLWGTWVRFVSSCKIKFNGAFKSYAISPISFFHIFSHFSHFFPIFSQFFSHFFIFLHFFSVFVWLFKGERILLLARVPPVSGLIWPRHGQSSKGNHGRRALDCTADSCQPCSGLFFSSAYENFCAKKELNKFDNIRINTVQNVKTKKSERWIEETLH